MKNSEVGNIIVMSSSKATDSIYRIYLKNHKHILRIFLTENMIYNAFLKSLIRNNIHKRGSI